MKKTAFTLLSLLLFISTHGQISFEDHIISGPNDYENAAWRPWVVFSVDIDGDGDIDILSTSILDQKIAWYENLDGLGDFGSQQIIGNNYSTQIIAGDLDSDGDMDIVTNTYNSEGRVSWYENLDGLGDFSAEQIITNISYPRSIDIGDIDNDGDLDLTVSSNRNNIIWLENIDGLANFGSEHLIDTDFHERMILKFGDMDGDGDLDIVSPQTGNSPNYIVWYENTDGLGDFSIEHNFSSDIIHVFSINVNDLDNDGDLDVLAESSGELIWFENINGLGEFGPKQIIDEYNGASYSISAADFDSDGDIDVLGTKWAENNIVWYENTDGIGNFSDEIIITTDAWFPISTNINDINNDGNIDVISASITEDKITWFNNTDGLGNFEMQQALTPDIYDPTSVYTCDLDNDGDLDVLATFDDDYKVVWYENLDGNGIFGDEQIINNTVLSSPWSVIASDLDSDGDLDVITCGYHNGTLVWYENLNGLGDFGPEQEFPSDIYRLHTAIARDIDNDGDIDVLGAGFQEGTITWYENLDGEGNFSSHYIRGMYYGNGITDVFLSDLDGDGDSDVLYSNSISSTGEIGWYENTDGLGDFSVEHIITDTIEDPRSVYSIDLDGDNKLDILAASEDDNKIVWYKNLGFGDFGEVQIISISAIGAHKVFSSDIDGDGDMDVLAGSIDDNKIAWYENSDGLGNFSDELIITTTSDQVPSVYTGDINGDNKMDVLSVSRIDGKVVWHENLGLLSVDESSSQNFLIYPNPSSNLLTIESKIPIRSIAVYNELGQIISVKTNSNSIDISKLSNGIYFLKIKDNNNNSETKQIVKK